MERSGAAGLVTGVKRSLLIKSSLSSCSMSAGLTTYLLLLLELRDTVIRGALKPTFARIPRAEVLFDDCRRVSTRVLSDDDLSV